MGEIKRVRPGEKLRIAAEDWNRLAAIANQGLPLDGGAGSGAGAALDRQSRILVRNDTGGSVPRFGAMLASAPIVVESSNADEYKNRPSLKGIMPDGPAGTRAVLVPQSPVATGRIAQAVIAGFSVALVTVTDAGHQFADLTAGATKLSSAATGPCRIVWKPTGTGDKLCLVLVNQSAAPAQVRIRVKISDPVAISGATATVGGTSQAVRWTYTLTQVRWDYATNANIEVSGGVVVSGATNENEDGNSSTKLGPGYLVSNITAGWKYMAASKCGDGTSNIDCFHEAWTEVDPTNGTVSWRFNHPNTVDGGCP